MLAAILAWSVFLVSINTSIKAVNLFNLANEYFSHASSEIIRLLKEDLKKSIVGG